MTKKITLSLFILMTSFAIAQQGDASAYSFYGIGDFKADQTIENRSMGGAAIQADSIHFNFQNPASHGAIKLTTMSFGGSYSRLTITDQSNKGNAARSSIDYVAIGIPLGKLSVVGGLKPITSIGYDITSPSDGTTPHTTDTGKGGINQLFFGTGIKVIKDLYVGIEGNFSFGKTTTDRTSIYPDVQFATQTNTKSVISGIGYKIGLIYSKKLSDNHKIHTSLSYAPSIGVTSSNTQTLSTIVPNSSTPFDTKKLPVSNSQFKIPGQTSFGIGYGENKKWFIGVQASTIQASQLSNRLLGASNASYEDATRYAIGGHYTPDYKSYSDYYKKITYRLGFRTENTGLVINNESINDYGMTFGLGLPVGANLSNLNIGFEYGSKGTTRTNLVKENYFSILIGLSINDKWFKKSKID